MKRDVWHNIPLRLSGVTYGNMDRVGVETEWLALAVVVRREGALEVLEGGGVVHFARAVCGVAGIMSK